MRSNYIAYFNPNRYDNGDEKEVTDDVDRCNPLD
jgi:hypothetical protein